MKKILFMFFFIGMTMGIASGYLYPNFQTYQQKRENVISLMENAIDQEIKAGNYKCCIDPPCTMCFLGEWLWDDGICRCDDMIASGEFDKVCPECKSGIESGECKSSQKGFCVIPD